MMLPVHPNKSTLTHDGWICTARICARWLVLLSLFVFGATSAAAAPITVSVTNSAAGVEYNFTVSNDGTLGQPIFQLLLLSPADPSIFDANLRTPIGWGDGAGGFASMGPDLVFGGTYFFWEADLSTVYDIGLGSSLTGFGFLALASLGDLPIYYDLNNQGLFGLVEPPGQGSEVPEPGNILLMSMGLIALSLARRFRGLGVLLIALSIPGSVYAASWTLSGYVVQSGTTTGIAGASVTLTAGTGTPRLAVTQTSGKFEFTGVLAGQSYTLNVSKAGFLFQGLPFTFTMPERNYPLLDNIRGTPGCANGTCSITVTVKTSTGSAVSGALLSMSGSKTEQQSTNTLGTAVFRIAEGGTVTIAASKSGFSFSPPSTTISNLTSNVLRAFTANSTQQPISISGSVKRADNGTDLQGIVIVLSTGGTAVKRTTDLKGSYVFDNLQASMAYSVAPESGQGYSFTPNRISVTPAASVTLQTIFAQPSPLDVVFSTFQLLSSSSAVGNPVTVRYALLNNSNVPVEGFQVKFTMARTVPASPILVDPVTDNIGPLEAMKSTPLREVTFYPPAGAAPGPYIITALIDPTGQLKELPNSPARTNNRRDESLTLHPKLGYGVTVITHGQRSLLDPDGENPSDWQFKMAMEIAKRAGYARILVTDRLNGGFRQAKDEDAIAAGYKESGGFDGFVLSANGTGETIVILNWRDEAKHVMTGWSEPAADAFFALLMRQFKLDGPEPSSRGVSFPLQRAHFIGHSRGTVVNSEIVERLLAAEASGELNPRVEDLHVTNLDPHDWGNQKSLTCTELGTRVADGFNDCDVNREIWNSNSTTDPITQQVKNSGELVGVIAWKGINFTDTIWQEGDSTNPLELGGREILGSMSCQLSPKLFDIDEHDRPYIQYTASVSSNRLEGPWESGDCSLLGYGFSRLGGVPRPTDDTITQASKRNWSVVPFLYKKRIMNGLFKDRLDWQTNENGGNMDLSGWSYLGGQRFSDEVDPVFIEDPQPNAAPVFALQVGAVPPRRLLDFSSLLVPRSATHNWLYVPSSTYRLSFEILDTFKETASSGSLLQLTVEDFSGSSLGVDQRVDLSACGSHVGGRLVLSGSGKWRPCSIDFSAFKSRTIRFTFSVDTTGDPAPDVIARIRFLEFVPDGLVDQTRPEITVNGGDVQTAQGPSIVLSGVVRGTYPISEMSWSSDNGGSGPPLNVSNLTWTTPAIMLKTGVTSVTLKATDNKGNVGSKTVLINYAPTVTISIHTVPSGLPVYVDNLRYTSPVVLERLAGTPTILSVLDAVSPGLGTRYVQPTWSNGRPTTQTVVPLLSSTLVATYKTQFLVQSSVSPAAGGIVVLSPVSTDGYYSDGQLLQASGLSSAGYEFKSWSGLTGTSAILFHTVRAPISIVANFAISSPGGNGPGVWTSAADMPTARLGLGAGIGVVRGKITVIGHHEGNPGSGRVNEEFDPVTNRWATKTPYPRVEGRLNLTQNAVIGDKIYLIGGANIWNNYHTQTVDAYDPVTDAWELNVSVYPVPVGLLATVAYGGKIYCFGGMNYVSQAYTSSYVFDPVTRLFSPLATMPRGRSLAHAFVKDGKIWVAGGFTYPSTVLPHIDVYDPATNQWQAGPALPRSDQFPAWAGTVGDGQVFLVYSPGPSFKPIVYKLESTWVQVSEAPLPQSNFGVAVSGNALFTIGGGDPKSRTVQRYGPSDGAGSLPAPVQLTPSEGETFSIYPRVTNFSWAAVSGAVQYGIEIDCYHCCAYGQWCADVGGSTYVKTLTGNSFTFDWWGAQPGRWRVWAIDSSGRQGSKSGWRTFSYTY